MTGVIRVLCWNIGLREKPMQDLMNLGCDVALIQEAPLSGESWEREHYDRGARICRLSNRTDVIGFKNIPIGRRPGPNEFAVSAAGTIAAARIIPESDLPFIAISLYARWEKPHPDTPTTWAVGFADAMAHRAISDLSAFIGHKDPATHRILVAGDFNLIHGATEQNHLALPERDRSVFERLQSLGFEFVGPQHPNGRMAAPTQRGLPADTKNVPTYYTTQQQPGTAANQLDYVFASRGFHRTVQARALNEPEEWGPSDHCLIVIEVSPETFPAGEAKT